MVEDVFQAQIDTMIEKQQLFAQDKTQVDIAYPLIEQFLKSKLAQRLYQAEKTGQAGLSGNFPLL